MKTTESDAVSFLSLLWSNEIKIDEQKTFSIDSQTIQDLELLQIISAISLIP